MNTHKKTVRDVEVRGKKVLLRCDFNVMRVHEEIAQQLLRH